MEFLENSFRAELEEPALELKGCFDTLQGPFLLHHLILGLIPIFF